MSQRGNRQANQPPKWKKWRTAGHFLQAVALCASFAAVFLNAKVASLQENVDDLRREEWYFITNNTAIENRIDAVPMLTLSLNQVELIRKLGRGLIPSADVAMMRKNEEITKRLIKAKRFEIASGAHLLSRERPAPGYVESLRTMSEDEIIEKSEIARDEASLFIGGVKDRMVASDRDLKKWKVALNWVLGLSAFLALLAAVVLSKSESMRDGAV